MAYYQIIKLSADFCNPCKVLSAKLEELGLKGFVKELDIDTAEGAEYVSTYGIRSVPSVIIISEKDTKVFTGDNCLQAIQIAVGDC